MSVQTYVHQRADRFRLALRDVDEMLRGTPDAPGASNARTLFAAFSRHPDQAVASRRASRVQTRLHDGIVFVPVRINGKTASYILDTGANFSTLSESEAARLGLTLGERGGEGTDSTGGSVQVRVAIADELQVGDMRVRHVAFLVLRDDQQPFVTLPPAERGVIGLPVLLALRTLRWSVDGTLEIGFPSPKIGARRPNLCFEGATPITQAGVGSRTLLLALDTGASKTDLWPLFATTFADEVASAERGSRRVTGVGQSVDVEALALPALTLRVGDRDTVLRPAHVLLKPVGEAWLHGRLGLDVLTQARRVTLDFDRMILTLE